MKKIFKLALFIPLISFWGCEDKAVRIYEANSPITISFEDFRAIKPKLKTERKLENPGKIYLYNNALYINERGKGVHVFDNSNPSNPIAKGFIPIHCNYDVAVYGNTMYAGSYSDLLMFDVVNPFEPVYVGRSEDVFNPIALWVEEGLDSELPIETFNTENEVVLKWEVEEVEEELGANGNSNIFFQNNDLTVFNGVEVNSAFSGGTGVGGSMASFTIMKNTIYVLDNWSLKYTSLLNPRNLPEFEELSLSRTAQTLFPQGDNLFIGTTTGMLIYDVAYDGALTHLSNFNHWTGCDPVVVSEGKAYVTLSSGCANAINQMDVVDVSDLTNPTLIKSYEFEHPLGLGVDENTLFLCDDYDGLKVFNVEDPTAIKSNLIKHYNSINAYDVIPWHDLLIMVGNDGIFQYDYSDPENMVQLSQIQVK